MREKGIIWFRNDLRLVDNEALVEATQQCESVLPIYVFDSRLFQSKTRYGFPKIGVHRAQFVIDSIHDLRKNLRKLGSDLIVRVGIPEEEIFEIARYYKSSYIYCNRERTSEEVMVQDNLEELLWSVGQELRYSRGKMLYYTSDLPFPITHAPDQLVGLKKEVERYIKIREPLPRPDYLFTKFDDLEVGKIPELKDLYFDEEPATHFTGGETAGMERLSKCYSGSKDDNLSNGEMALSPWISLGCLSPKMIYHYRKKDLSFKSKGDHPYYKSLMVRDYHRLMGKKYGNQIFQSSGISRVGKRGQRDENVIIAWINGETEEPLINAIMKNLKHDGYVGKTARKITASFFIHNLQQDWLIGAQYFESKLIDYDPCSNYGNWMYLAGVGAESKEIKPLNMRYLSEKLDPDRVYQNRWNING